MKKGLLRVWLLFIPVIAGAVISLGSSYKPPERYAHDFTATGLVERVHPFGFGKAHCKVEVATYRWVNLSPHFPLQRIPQEGQRYILYATGNTCHAVQVARVAATQRDIFF